MPRLLQALHQAGILTDDLALPDSFDNPEACYRGLCKLPDREANGKFLPRRRRRIDILSMPWKNRGGALLYYTVRCILSNPHYSILLTGSQLPQCRATI